VGSPLGFVGSLPESVDFVAWVHRLGSLVRGFAAGFVVNLLLRVVLALISCLCLHLYFCCFFGCRRFLFFIFLFFSQRGEGFVDFFQRGAKEEEEEIGFLAFSCGTRVPSEFLLKSSL